MSEAEKAPKVGMLVEDTRSIEVEDAKTGQQKLVRAPDRTAAVEEMKKNPNADAKPLHD